MEKREIQDFLRFLEDVERLKRVPRSGWWYYGIENPESVADHSFGVVSLSFFLSTLINQTYPEAQKLDTTKVIKMAILHELGETRLGDLQREARKFIGEDRVEEAEAKVVEEITEGLGRLGEEIRNIHREFVLRKSPEARLVHLVDKMELLFQAFLYKKYGYKNLDLILEGQKNLKERFPHPLIDLILFEIDSKGRMEGG